MSHDIVFLLRPPPPIIVDMLSYLPPWPHVYVRVTDAADAAGIPSFGSVVGTIGVSHREAWA